MNLAVDDEETGKQTMGKYSCDRLYRSTDHEKKGSQEYTTKSKRGMNETRDHLIE